ncbi:hypothetical protein H1D32_12320 [Anaerobacillus sp. CMMVII]|uniref:hypothetical protein n=1 Tax=Anaerobacillus sp. CMMVII TaxID=2755588 RepID=UPI0021B84453|nr:hypothetical protein [Anaerobacillus sp. CMMVII]MCT8138456.1 hypothetical protein [Anaerobacillus sp. CMMVII]
MVIDRFNHGLDDSNLYLRIFDYLAYELTTSNSWLRTRFFDLLKKAYLNTCETFYLPVSNHSLETFAHLKRDSDIASAEYDLYDGKREADGKIAVILMSTPLTIVAIEAITDRNWQFKSDVENNLTAIMQLSQTDEKNAVQVLLVSKKLWEQNKRLPEEMANYKRLRNHLRHERNQQVLFVVLFLEDLLPLFEEDVSTY